MALRSKNFVTEPLSRLEMRNIVRQVDFINRGDRFVYNLTESRLRGRSGLEEAEGRSSPLISPPTILCLFLASLPLLSSLLNDLCLLSLVSL